MKEVKHEAQAYIVDMVHDCGGIFDDLPTSRLVHQNNKYLYPHKCNRCGEVELFPNHYPRTEFKRLK